MDKNTSESDLHSYEVTNKQLQIKPRKTSEAPIGFKPLFFVHILHPQYTHMIFSDSRVEMRLPYLWAVLYTPRQILFIKQV